jgi:hypothetical protein
VRRFAYVVEEVAGGGERGSDLVSGTESKRGVRGQPDAVGVEDEGPAERDERWAELGDLDPCRYAADAGDDLVLVRLVAAANSSAMARYASRSLRSASSGS